MSYRYARHASRRCTKRNGQPIKFHWTNQSSCPSLMVQHSSSSYKLRWSVTVEWKKRTSPTAQNVPLPLGNTTRLHHQANNGETTDNFSMSIQYRASRTYCSNGAKYIDSCWRFQRHVLQLFWNDLNSSAFSNILQCKLVTTVLVTGPPNGPVLFCSLAFVVCRRRV